MKTTYYYIKVKNLLGRFCNDQYEIYDGKTWVFDREGIILGYRMGYDPSEGPDSPYGIGDTETMREISEISYEEAEKIIHQLPR